MCVQLGLHRLWYESLKKIDTNGGVPISGTDPLSTHGKGWSLHLELVK